MTDTSHPSVIRLAPPRHRTPSLVLNGETTTGSAAERSNLSQTCHSLAENGGFDAVPADVARAALALLAAISSTSHTMPAAEFVTLDQGAAISGLSPSTLERLVMAGEIPAVRIPPVKPSGTGKRSKVMLRLEVRDIRTFMRRHKRIVRTGAKCYHPPHEKEEKKDE